VRQPGRACANLPLQLSLHLRSIRCSYPASALSAGPITHLSDASSSKNCTNATSTERTASGSRKIAGGRSGQVGDRGQKCANRPACYGRQMLAMGHVLPEGGRARKLTTFGARSPHAITRLSRIQSTTDLHPAESRHVIYNPTNGSYHAHQGSALLRTSSSRMNQQRAAKVQSALTDGRMCRSGRGRSAAKRFTRPSLPLPPSC